MSIQRLISLPSGMKNSFKVLEEDMQGNWFCDSDPEGMKVGSGGGSANMLASAYRQAAYKGDFKEWLRGSKRMIIHSGGESRRLPAYAPYGKSLLPMPVFRWSKGQHMDQKLLDFQVSFYERILKKAPGSYSTLIGSGDVMFISSDRFRDLPEADVLVFGIWVEDSIASRHGVFFSRREKQEELAFVRQKPSQEDLRDASQDYYYLMDSGIVMLNADATLMLMQRSGWDEKKAQFGKGVPDYYDLYSEMLTSFGTESSSDDSELKNLDVKLVPLRDGEFYHFGSNSDLIESTLKLQNRIIDQRLTLTKELDHHPSIFQQNSVVRYRFEPANHHLWIENSHVPETWEIHHHHIFTGVPENQWQLSFPEQVCLDVVPVGSSDFCIRTYGFSDGFKDTLEEGAQWMHQSMDESVSGEMAGGAGNYTPGGRFYP